MLQVGVDGSGVGGLGLESPRVVLTLTRSLRCDTRSRVSRHVGDATPSEAQVRRYAPPPPRKSHERACHGIAWQRSSLRARTHRGWRRRSPGLSRGAGVVRRVVVRVNVTKRQTHAITSKCNWGSRRLRYAVMTHEPRNNTQRGEGAHRRDRAILVGAVAHFFHRLSRHTPRDLMAGFGHVGRLYSQSGHDRV
jgi:hypothetical protein